MLNFILLERMFEPTKFCITNKIGVLYHGK